MSGVRGGWQPKTSDAGSPPVGGGGGKEPVLTIQDHYRRQASPEVWAEIDALRARVSSLCAEGEFLCARLRELECSILDDDVGREYYGHVAPSRARLEMLLAKARGDQ